MNNKAINTIPDIDAYLSRINIEKCDSCSIEYLDKLILAHQYAVPFEDLDIYDFHMHVDITIEKIFEKIVNRGRGGYCFELNALFCSLLISLGYNAYPCLAQVVYNRDDPVPSLHRLTIVQMKDEKYVCDVGFGGPQPGFALKIENDFIKISNSGIKHTYKVVSDGNWWTLYYKSGESWNKTIRFNEIEMDEIAFVVPNYFCCYSDDSAFTNTRLVNMKTETGNKSITDNTFIEIINHKREEHQISNTEELNIILKNHFGINL